MLARTTRLSYVCLRCQRRLLNAKSPLEAPSHSSAYSAGRRWSHAAAQIQQDEEDDHLDGGQPQNNDSPSSAPDVETVAERSYSYRRWRPSKTAPLGVNSLGKPAEVLILPSRDRRIPKVPKEEENKARLNLQESLASEQAPLSIQDLMANIEQVVRSSGIDKKRGQLEVKEWEVLQSSLAKGFKLDQLRRYIAYKHKKSLSTDAFHRVNRQNKPDTIKYLVEEVWGFTVPVMEKQSKKKRRTLSLYIPDEAKLDHLLKDRGQPLKRVAEELDVQIDVFRRDSRIRVSGAAANAAAALARISRLTKDLQPIIIPLQGIMGDAYRDPALKLVVKSYLDSVQQKFDVQIALTPDHIKIVYHEQHRLAQQAHREIRLAVETDDQPQNVDIWPPETRESSSLQPFPTPPEFSRRLLQCPSARLVDTTPLDQASRRDDLDSAGVTSLDSLIGKIQDWLNLPTLAKNPKSRHDLRYHVTARFGQAIFPEPSGNGAAKTGKGIKVRPESADTTVPSSANQVEEGTTDCAGAFGSTGLNDEAVLNSDTRSERPSIQAGASAAGGQVTGPVDLKLPLDLDNPAFTSQIPYLIQQIALMKPWSQATSRLPKDIEAAARLTLRLEFSPIDSGTGSQDWPTFEVLVTSGESLDGKRPPLNLARVSAVHQQRSFTILCPTRHVDVRVTQQVKQDILYRGAGKEPQHSPLVRAIKGYFSRTDTDEPTEWLFQPFVNLPVADSMQGIAKLRDDAIEEDSRRKDPSKLTAPALKKESVAYILRAVDVMDVDSREVAIAHDSVTAAVTGKGKQRNKGAVKYCLDHVTLTGTEATRQELQLAQHSVLDAPSLTPPDMATFVKAALGLADRLGEDPTTTTRDDLGLELQLPPGGEQKANDSTPDKKKRSARKVSKVVKKVKVPVKKTSSSPRSRGTTQVAES